MHLTEFPDISLLYLNLINRYSAVQTVKVTKNLLEMQMLLMERGTK